ncbi:GIY-YIG nuclease family protein [Azospirillum sp.]|uniref:GIY-YIG nuclease family protein n=1 Tax=Azospirillum sp. TaxID=34012 RepID=UPI002D52B3E1|nr:GIY-YIG nuclease family protein [Azospirillum sp.]HYD66143.1 GIY-YIG nuclease family protein [Azospirillum sp.]
MSVFKVRNSPYYQYDFRREGHRYSGSTKCLKLADAEAFEIAQIGLVERRNESLKLAAILPRHVIREPLGDGWRYYFIVPSKARKAGCPVRNESLGTVLDTAIARAEDHLLPEFDAWHAKHKTTMGVNGVTERSDPPLVGVYLLLLKGKVVYIGSSKNMPRRVRQHRNGSRPFDNAYYIAASESEMRSLEASLIKAMLPTQNTSGIARRQKAPCPAPEYPDAPSSSL